MQTSILTTSIFRKRESVVKHVNYEVNVTAEYMHELIKGQSGGTKAGQGMASAVPLLMKLFTTTSQSILQDKTAMDELRSADLIVALSVFPTASYLAVHLNKPFIMLHPSAFTLFGSLAQVPLPPSYIPMIQASDSMNFVQRTKNFLLVSAKNLAASALFDYSIGSFFAKRGICKGKSYAEIVGNAEMHIVSHDFTIEFAHPLMPSEFTLKA